jgi:DNA-binding NarL/FixJ family response regulator
MRGDLGGRLGSVSRADEEPDWFVGRDDAIRRLRECATGVRAGRPRLASVEGHAGIGKTALVNRFLAELGDFAVLRASAHPTETEFALGVVTQLVAGVAPAALARFPLLAGDDLAARPFRVGLELLGLLGELQLRSPVALVVDDAPWADRESVHVLGSVLRRLFADRVLVVLTARAAADGAQVKDGIDGEWRSLTSILEAPCQVRLGAFTRTETGMLVERIAGRIQPRAVARLHERSGGHPLYLRALLTELTPAQLNSAEALPVPDSLAGLMRFQTAALSDQARALVEALAVLDMRCSLATAAQVAGVTNAPAALESLLAMGLVTWRPGEPATPVEIRHALIRDSIYHGISPERRRHLHAACVPVVDTFARWRHRVAATTHSDAELAGELESSAAIADPGRAATMLLWAADVSPTREEYERRLLQAATLLQRTVQFTRARQLHDAVQSCAPSPLRSCYLGLYATHDGRMAEGELLLTEVMRQAESDERLAPLIPLCAGFLAGNYLQQSRHDDVIRLLEPIVDAGRWPASHRLVACTMLTLAHLYIRGPAAALEVLHRRGGLAESAETVPASDALLLVWRGLCRLHLGRLSMAEADLGEALRLSALAHDQETEPQAHTWLAVSLYFLGRWDQALVHAEHALSISLVDHRVWQIPTQHAWLGLVYAGQGAWDAADRHIEASQKVLGRPRLRTNSVIPAFAQASLARAHEDFAQVRAVLRPITALAIGDDIDRPLRVLRPWWLPLWAEASIADGALSDAEEALAELDAMAAEMPQLRVEVGRLRGLLAERRGDRDAAVAAYVAAAEIPATPDDLPLYRAMLEQAYARLLLEDHDRRSAVAWLRAAHDRFVAMGAQPYVERTSRELAACGLGSPKATGGELLALSDRERAIARLAAQGSTNEAIARELYVSIKTVEYHLSRAYAKLGVTSRRELRQFI